MKYALAMLWLLPVLVPSATAQSYTPFGDAFLSQVYSTVSAHPNHGTSVTIRENDAPSEYAGWTSGDGSGNIVIEIFTSNIKGSFTDDVLSSLTNNHWEGILFMLMAHESYHACRKSWELYSDDCYNEDFSCEHLALEASAASDTCDFIGEQKEIINNPESTQEEIDDATEKLEGACGAYNAAQDKWNSDEGRDAANDCTCGNGDCPFVEKPSCNASLPPPPPGKDCENSGDEPFGPGDDVIPDCEDEEGNNCCE